MWNPFTWPWFWINIWMGTLGIAAAAITPANRNKNLGAALFAFACAAFIFWTDK